MLASEKIHVVTLLAPTADRYNTNPQSDFVSLANYQSLMAVLEHGAGATGTCVITVQNATDAAGTSPTDIPFRYRRVSATGTSDVEGAITDVAATGLTITAGSNQIYIIEIEADELDQSKPWVAITLTESVNSPVDASLLGILSGARYPGSTHLTAIA